MSDYKQKKALEKHKLIKFISSLEVPAIDIKESETPDFYISLFQSKVNDKLISLEMTDIIDFHQKKREAIHEKIIEYAKTQFKSLYQNANLTVYITFIEYEIPKKGTEVNEIANQIFDLVCKVYNNISDFKFRVEKTFDIGIKAVSNIIISNEHNFCNWQSIGCHKREEIDTEWLIKKIRTKEALIPKYQKKVDEKWLLLISYYGHKSSSHIFDNVIIDDDLDFDKVYVYEYMPNSIIELK